MPPVVVAAGAELPYAVDVTHDFDTKTTVRYGRKTTTYVPDGPLRYQWSADGGTFRESTRGQTVVWIAPTNITEATTVTLECVIDDPPGPRVPPGDTGTRDDEPVKRSFTVLVMPRTPQISWRFIRPEDRYNPLAKELKQTLGGQVALQLIVKVAPQTRVAPAMDTVTLRLREEEDAEHNIKHAEAEDHAEFRFDLNDPQWDVWEAKYEKAGPASTPVLRSRADEGGGRVKKENVSLDTDILYIRTVPWNTTAKLPTDLDGAGPRPASVLLGHNGEHQVALHEVNGEPSNAVFLFDKSMEQGRWESLPYAAAPTLHQVGNLVIKSVSTSNGTSDYFKFDPDSEAVSTVNPTITFEIEDEGDKGTLENPHAYKWEIKIRSTSSENRQWTIFATGQMPLGSKTVVINSPSSPDIQQGSPIYRGTYAFDIEVKEWPNSTSVSGVPLDTQSLRSPSLSVPLTYETEDPETGAQINANGHEVYTDWESQGQPQLRLTYRLEDAENKAAKNVDITVFDPNWQSKNQIQGQTEVGVTADIPVLNYDDNSVSGNHKVLITGSDDHADSYRDHKSRRMTATNGYKDFNVIQWIAGTDLAGRGFYGIWVQRSKLGHSTNRQVRTDLLKVGQGDDLPTVFEHVWDKTLRDAGWTPGVEKKLTTKIGNTWGAVNGTFFSHKSSPYLVQGDLGVNGVWADPNMGGVQYQRWSFNITNSGFSIGRMEPTGRTSGTDLYRSSASIRAAPSGLGGVGLLINGEFKPNDPAYVMEGSDGEDKANGVKGSYSELKGPLARTMACWSDDGQHLFMIMVQGTSFLGTGNGDSGWKWQDAQFFAGYSLDDFIKNITSVRTSNGKRNKPLNIKIGGAVLLDGGSHSSIVYTRQKVNAKVGPYSTWQPALSAMVQARITESHDEAGAPNFPMPDGNTGGHRPNRTVLEAFIR